KDHFSNPKILQDLAMKRGNPFRDDLLYSDLFESLNDQDTGFQVLSHTDDRDIDVLDTDGAQRLFIRRIALDGKGGQIADRLHFFRVHVNGQDFAAFADQGFCHSIAESTETDHRHLPFHSFSPTIR